MDNDLKLNDIADDLLILNKTTIDTLFKLDNCTDCISLYVFYYKTAKWQKTDTIKANDLYIQKCLKWGTKKIRETKKALKENGLIDIVQRRKNNKIEGWYIRVSYLVSQRKTEDIVINVEESNNAPKQQVDEATSSFEEINALKEIIKSLKKEIEMLKNNNKSIKDTYYENKELNDLFIDFLEVRKKLKAVNSERAINSLLKTLSKYDDATKYKMIENSITNSWKGVFPLKKENTCTRGEQPIRQEIVPEWMNCQSKAEVLSDKEQKEMEDLLKEFQDP